ncbi:MAG: polyprenyl synthetase family protein [Oscillospiraceae bacterium]|nr:polyprenyl synthetase family protein [Oscillospiraceae bacterium]
MITVIEMSEIFDLSKNEMIQQKFDKVIGAIDVTIIIKNRCLDLSKLYNLCKSTCKNTHLIGTIDELVGNGEAIDSISKAEKIGLISHTSTQDDADEVLGYISFLLFMRNARSEIEGATNDYFDKLLHDASGNQFIVDALSLLNEQNKGGKRVRGAMIKLGEQIASLGRSNNYIPIAMGYELFSTSILVHDDIVDKSDTRRGRPTIHCATFEDNKKSGMTDSTAEHLGISNAVCIGDYGYFIANQIITDAKLDSSILLEVFKLFSKIQSNTSEGEIMDVFLPYKNISISDNYDEYVKTVKQIYEYKTAWYTLAGPIMLGAICGEADNDLLEILKKIAIPLGIAYQVKDDLLGIFSSDEILGKPILSDIKEKKQTLMYGYAYKNADENDRTLLDSCYGNENVNMCGLNVVRDIFVKTGAKKFAEDEIARLSKISKNFIESSSMEKEYKSLLSGLLVYLTLREY